MKGIIRSAKAGNRAGIMRRRRLSCGGFTMVELLVVIVIILILSGVVYRVGSHVMRRTGRARAVYELGMLHGILDEYYAVYGHYPPADRWRYTDEMNLLDRNRYPRVWDGYREHYRGEGPHGAMYYLWAQYNLERDPPQPHSRPTAAEKAAYENGWLPLIRELVGSESVGRLHFRELSARQLNPGLEDTTLNHSNWVATIYDPYDREWVYRSIPPGDDAPQSYMLFSRGPDGVEGTTDDIGRDRWAE